MYRTVRRRYLLMVIILIAMFLACVAIMIASVEEQKIDSLRPTVEACYHITEDWCWKYTRFADAGEITYNENSK